MRHTTKNSRVKRVRGFHTSIPRVMYPRNRIQKNGPQITYSPTPPTPPPPHQAIPSASSAFFSLSASFPPAFSTPPPTLQVPHPPKNAPRFQPSHPFIVSAPLCSFRPRVNPSFFLSSSFPIRIPIRYSRGEIFFFGRIFPGSRFLWGGDDIRKEGRGGRFTAPYPKTLGRTHSVKGARRGYMKKPM